MPRSRTDTTGVIARDAHIQIDLRAQGYGRERLDLEPTPANIANAARLRQEILRKIERGTFVFAHYFPDSKRISEDKSSTTFDELGKEWLKTRKGQLEHSTIDHYEQTLGSKHFTDWQDKHLGDLDYRTLMGKLGALPEHPKTFNNIASVLQMVLAYGHKAQLLREPLHEHIELRKVGKAKPDPLTLAEADMVLSKMRDPRGTNYYEFAFFTGLRPSEQIALRWSNVDLRAGTVLVKAAITRSKEKGTKTGEERTVELNARSRAAIERQRAVSQLAGGFVFLGLDGEPYTTTDGPLDAFWKPAARQTGMRYRDARQTRHTFATMCLHAGLKPGWIAQQLGHSTEMFFRIYSKWLEAQDRGAERGKLDAFLTADRDINRDIGNGNN